MSRALLAGTEAFRATVRDFAVCFLFELTASDGKPLRWLWQEHSEPQVPFSEGPGAPSAAGRLGEAAAGEARMTQTFKKSAAAVQVPTCTLLSVLFK